MAAAGQGAGMYGAFCYVCLWEYTWLVQEHAPVQLSCGCVACRRCVCWWLRGQVGCPQPECWNGHPIVGMVATTEADALTDTLAMLPETGPAAPEQPTHAAPPSEAAFSAGRLPLEFLTVTGECLGVGGAGTVYGGLLQLLEGTKLPVAVKTDTAPEHGGRRMRREIVIAMHISQACPLTCRVYGYVEQGDQLLMVMERCQRSLAGRLAELGGRGLPQGELARVAVDLCTSLAQLHACGVVHSDIKPGNCLVRADERGTVVLADFGACKRSDRTAWSTIFATHCYASYEHLSAQRGRRPALAWDIFSIAATLCHLATGVRPFRDVAPATITVEHVQGRVLEHMRLGDVADPALRAILARSLSSHPAQRPTADELLRDVEQWAASE